jgi:hypothetical protein
MITRLALLSALVAVATPVASAQTASSLVGHWSGAVREDGSIPIYTLSVHLALDTAGRLVGLVEYDAFPCAGVWSNAQFTGGAWRLEETITVNKPNCAPAVDIELSPVGRTISVRLRPIGSSANWSTGVLYPRP